MEIIELFKDYCQYLKARKKYWLIPIIIVFIIVSIVVIFAESSSLAPFIYTVF
jgi:t-SNARE complex subunit (syntaxin)